MLPLQVHLQTQQEVRLRMTGMALQVVRSDGILALYNGLSASLCRQVPQPWGDSWPGLFQGVPLGPGPSSQLRAMQAEGVAGVSQASIQLWLGLLPTVCALCAPKLLPPPFQGCLRRPTRPGELT